MSSSNAFSAYPPYRHHTTTRIPPSRALSLLSAYLVASTQDASLRPNALLAESGPKAAAFSLTSTGHGGAGGGGLVLHNLRRVEAGLKGEYLGADAEVDFRGGLLEGEKEGDKDEKGRFRPSLRNIGVGAENAIVAAAGMGGELEVDGENEWQDREEFEREQVVVGGGALGEKGIEVERRDREVNEEVPMVKETKSSGNKEERKRRKKDKRMKEKKEPEVKRQRERRVED